jgi:ankyrin repeat protein
MNDSEDENPLHRMKRMGYPGCQRRITVLGMWLAPVLRRYFPKYWQRLSGMLIHNAAWMGEEQILLRLLERGVDPDTRDTMLNATPLMHAALQGQIRVMELLLHAGADVNARADYGGTALMNAAEFGDTECISFLLDAGAEMDAVESAFGNTALFRAAQMGELAAVRLLVERGADTQIRMKANKTAAEWVRLVAQGKQAKLACADYLEKREGETKT